MQRHHHQFDTDIVLESGQTLHRPEITYHTWGKLNDAGDNVVWVFHALTANSDPSDWWSGLVGEHAFFNPKDHFIVCANILGSCYGSSGPLTENPATNEPYHATFPRLTMRDIVQAHQLLKEYLGIDRIRFGAGGSMGGYQLLEWELAEPGLFENMLLAVTSARESAWGKAIHASQRLAIEADRTWKDPEAGAGAAGLKAARGIGMLTYRNYETFVRTQSDETAVIDDFKAASYINYQGQKLVDRFNAYTYWLLTLAMDSHDVSRGRGPIEEVLSSIKSKALVVGVTSDILCPLPEQEFLAEHLSNGELVALDSTYGHDGFLIEFEAISDALRRVFG